MRFYTFLVAGMLTASVSALAQTAPIKADQLMSLQQSQIFKLQKSFAELTKVDGIADSLHPIAFKKSLYVYSTPLAIPSEGGRGSGATHTFTQKAVLSENNWDWNGESDTWNYPAPSQGGKVYARLTFSLNSATHWSPCFALRRQNLTGGVLKQVGRTITLPCGSLLGRRDTKPGSISVWVEWWNDNMPLAQFGQPSQTLEISGVSYGASGGPAGWTLGGLEIELYRTLSTR